MIFNKKTKEDFKNLPQEKVLDAYKPSKAQIDAGDVRAKELIKAESDLDSK